MWRQQLRQKLLGQQQQQQQQRRLSKECGAAWACENALLQVCQLACHMDGDVLAVHAARLHTAHHFVLPLDSNQSFCSFVAPLVLLMLD